MCFYLKVGLSSSDLSPFSVCLCLLQPGLGAKRRPRNYPEELDRNYVVCWLAVKGFRREGEGRRRGTRCFFNSLGKIIMIIVIIKRCFSVFFPKRCSMSGRWRKQPESRPPSSRLRRLAPAAAAINPATAPKLLLPPSPTSIQQVHTHANTLSNALITSSVTLVHSVACRRK